jgi:adenylate cyclase
MNAPLRRGAAVGALCAALAGALYLLSPTLFGAEWWLFDRYSRRLATSRPPDTRILLLTVSEDAVRNLAAVDYGRPPYSREVWALVVEELRRAGAKAIVFDLLFSEENPAAPEGDRAFAAAIDRAPVILGAQTELARAGFDRAGENPPWFWDIRGLQQPKRYHAALPHPVFHRAAGAGTLRFAAGDSAVAHRYPLADPVAGGHLGSLALEAARLYLGTERKAARLERSLSFGGRRVPVDADLQMLVRWSGSRRDPRALAYPNVDLDKVIQAALLRAEGADAETLKRFEQQFRGRIVLIGYTAAGLMDLRANPLSPVAPGLELHANAVDNLINADFNRVAPRSLMFPLILFLGVATGIAVDATRSQVASAAIAALIVAAVVVAGYAALVQGLSVPAFTAATAVALTYVALTAVRLVEEQRQTALLKSTFGSYVSPQILEHILAHPERVRLGGERRDLTILFSDIRGFTSISEASEPEEVVEMLNEYLTRMVDILLAHGGTLDKFIGDAVMGFWNAPAAEPDHARLAVACAVEMVEETARLREKWEREGKAAIRIGIGVNTGEAVVGNIGSERVFGYTVIGDAVNLASRLEGKNKDYVTEIIVSESTLARMGGGFETVYLDEVRVKGKEKAVKIYQVKGRR